MGKITSNWPLWGLDENIRGLPDDKRKIGGGGGTLGTISVDKPPKVIVYFFRLHN